MPSRLTKNSRITIRNHQINHRIIRHLIFVFVLCISQVIQIQWIVDTSFTTIYWLFVFKDITTDLLFFYCISYFIVPNITQIRLYPILILSLIITYVIAYWSNYIMFRIIDSQNAYSNLSVVNYPAVNTIKAVASAYNKNDFITGLFNSSVFYITLTWYVGVVFPLTLVKIIRDYYKLQIKNSNYHKELIRLELDYLRTQINPHFLFNTLNNIYSMVAYTDKHSAEYILKLSTMMRYSLYETKHEKVELGKEIEFIENFLSLEKLRHGEWVKIGLEIVGNIDKKEIAPFLLITLIENAFKHGVLPAPNPSFIDIQLNLLYNSIQIEVKNSINTFTEAKSFGGVGLTNLNRRLNLIYPDSHFLNAQVVNHIYTVQLTLTKV